MTELYIKGPVLSPGLTGRPDMGLTDRPLTPQEIQKAAYSFTAGTPIVDVQHDFRKQAEVVESYIAPEDTQFNGKSYPAGTWFVTSRVTDPTLKTLIGTGELTGYSVGAFPENANIKGMFTDVGEKEWFALAVSIVKMPFYPEMIFKVFKQDEFIKKEFKANTEVSNMSDEDKSAMNLIEKLIDMLPINKGLEPVIEAPTPEITLEGLNESIENLRTEFEKVKQPTPEPEPVLEAEPEVVEEVEPEEVQAETETEEVETTEAEAEQEPEPEEEEKLIKKGISPDETTGNTKKSFMEKLGRDAFGNKL